MKPTLIAFMLACLLALPFAARAQQEEAQAEAESEVAPPPPPSDARVVDMTSLCRAPGSQRYYPIDALRQGMEGRVVLDCVLNEEGLVQSCQVVEEAPPNHGFGRASLMVACRATVDPISPNANTQVYERDGEHRVRRVVHWRLRN